MKYVNDSDDLKRIVETFAIPISNCKGGRIIVDGTECLHCQSPKPNECCWGFRKNRLNCPTQLYGVKPLKRVNRRIGFFFSDMQKDLAYPTVVVGKGPWNGQKAFIDKLIALQNQAKVWKYKYASFCRICGKLNGNQEYVLTTKEFKLNWPEGYLHYLQKHHVKPEQNEIDMVMAIPLR